MSFFSDFSWFPGLGIFGPMETLERKRQKLRRIFRGLETYGEGTAAQQATRYRLTEMYDDVVAAAKANSADVERPEIDLLVSLSGYSPETTLLAFELTSPKQVLVVTSEKTLPQIDIINEKIAGRLKASEFRHDTVDPVNPLDIYELVKKAVRPTRPGDPPIRAIIDITGGKKVMSASAALAASQLDLKMCYIDSEFDTETRQAIPGSEKLCILSNPTELFGDADMAAASQMFRAGSYVGAAERFGELSARVSEPARARYMRDLAALYQVWCDQDVAGLPERIEQVRKRIADPRSQLRPETARRLSDQVDFAQKLVAKDSSALLLNSYLLGDHYFSLGRHDFAALLFYRTIEKSLAERLRRAYGFNVSRPDYTLLDPDTEDLAARFEQTAKTVFRSERAFALPWRMQLMEAAIILFVLEDAMLPAIGIRGLGGLRHLRALADSRNQSVLAHGDTAVSKGNCEKLKQQALVHLRGFWGLHEPDQDVDQRIEIVRFITEA
jgi:Csm6 HEPN domain